MRHDDNTTIYTVMAAVVVTITLAMIVGIAGCGDDAAEATRNKHVQSIVKENADLRAELELRRKPEADQVEAFKAEKARHNEEIAELHRQLAQSEAAHVDTALAPLQETLNQMRTEMAKIRTDTQREIQAVRESMKHGFEDKCQCGR